MSGRSAIHRNATISMPWTIQTTLLFVLMVSSGIAGLVTYADIDRTLGAEQAMISKFTLGNTRYTIRNKDACLGEIIFSSKQETGSLTIDGSGSISVSHQGQRTDLMLELQASFNALKQLGASYLKVQNSQLGVMISTLDVRPINLSLKLIKPHVQELYSSQLGGPIVYELLNNVSIGIKGMGKSDSLAGVRMLAKQPIFKDIVLSQEENNSSCNADRGALDIESFINLSQSLTALLPEEIVP